MPLLPDLAQEVLLGAPGPHLIGRVIVIDPGAAPQSVLAPFVKNLEQWLSYLSVDQPWPSYAENPRNRTTFHEASRAVQRCIHRAEAGVP
jgi:hypothetical protein